MNRAALPEISHPTQAINVTIRIAGACEVTVDTHGSRGERGAYISVMAAGVAVYMYTATAAETYSDAWIDLAASASLKLLPEQIETGKTDRQADADSPAVVISAHGHDQVKHGFLPGRERSRAAAMIRIGHVVWLTEDRAAARTFSEAWRQVHNLAPIILGKVRSHRPLV